MSILFESIQISCANKQSPIASIIFVQIWVQRKVIAFPHFMHSQDVIQHHHSLEEPRRRHGLHGLHTPKLLKLLCTYQTIPIVKPFLRLLILNCLRDLPFFSMTRAVSWDPSIRSVCIFLLKRTRLLSIYHQQRY